LTPFLTSSVFYLDANPDCTAAKRLFRIDELENFKYEGERKGTTGKGGTTQIAHVRPLKKWQENVMGPLAWIGTGWYGQFIISRESIHARPKAFYINLLAELSRSRDPEESHYLERSWRLMFSRALDLSWTERIPLLFL